MVHIKEDTHSVSSHASMAPAAVEATSVAANPPTVQVAPAVIPYPIMQYAAVPDGSAMSIAVSQPMGTGGPAVAIPIIVAPMLAAGPYLVGAQQLLIRTRAESDLSGHPQYSLSPSVVHLMGSPAMSDLTNPQGESKQCNCKKSRCLKLYCDCFAANAFCKDCKRADCQNVPEHQEARLKAIEYKLARRPRAFDPKVNSVQSGLTLPATATEDARHSRGCNCKKSGCAKKYCECYQNGVACSKMCKCQECQNDGSLLHLRSFGVNEFSFNAAPSADAQPLAVPMQMPLSLTGQQASFMFVPYQSQSLPAIPQAGSKTGGEPFPTLEMAPKMRRKRGSKQCSFRMDLDHEPVSTRKRSKHRRQPSEDSLSSGSMGHDALSDSAYSGYSSGDVEMELLDVCPGLKLEFSKEELLDSELRLGADLLDRRTGMLRAEAPSTAQSDLLDLETHHDCDQLFPREDYYITGEVPEALDSSCEVFFSKIALEETMLDGEFVV